MKINDIVVQPKFRHEKGIIIEVLPMNRYRVKWLTMGNTSTYDAKYLKLA